LVYLCFKLPEKKRITATSPLVSMEAKYLPLAQNSPFTVLYSVLRRQHQLQYKNYMPQAKAAAIFPVMQKVPDSVPLQKKNVVVFILESFSRNYLTPGSPLKAHTPFFDSIIAHSTYFSNIFAQERSSNKGLTSILGSLPPFTDEPFFHSYYANTFEKGIGHIFKENGYNTNFFYGTEYDHFGFKRAMNMLGVDNYYCRVDYDNKDFYDGGLGMYDEPWLQYVAGKLNRIDTPFLAIEFNVSSHWPYKLPDSFLQHQAVPGQLLSQQSITYVDDAFSKMFEQIKNKPWFNNTIFVFCADHWFIDKDETKEDLIKSYEIPMFIYEPSNPLGQRLNTLGTQLDVLPTLYNKLGFKNPFTSFGKNLFDTSQPRYAFNLLFQNGIVQALNNQYVLGFNKNDDKSIYMYNYKKDSLRENNLLNSLPLKPVRDSLETQIKALVQQFNDAVLSGRLTP
jgi:phosphoglycerol transferase MdoB-like AlkP superfamily enzyme